MDITTILTDLLPLLQPCYLIVAGLCLGVINYALETEDRGYYHDESL